MLVQRRRRWANISPALGQRLVFAHLYHTKRWREMNGDRLTTAQIDRLRPSKNEALNQCWFDAGPASLTVGQHQPSIGSASRV